MGAEVPHLPITLAHDQCAIPMALTPHSRHPPAPSQHPVQPEHSFPPPEQGPCFRLGSSSF